MSLYCSLASCGYAQHTTSTYAKCMGPAQVWFCESTTTWGDRCGKSRLRQIPS